MNTTVRRSFTPTNRVKEGMLRVRSTRVEVPWSAKESLDALSLLSLDPFLLHTILTYVLESISTFFIWRAKSAAVEPQSTFRLEIPLASAYQSHVVGLSLLLTSSRQPAGPQHNDVSGKRDTMRYLGHAHGI